MVQGIGEDSYSCTSSEWDAGLVVLRNSIRVCVQEQEAF